MRTSEERVQEMHRRMGALETAKTRRYRLVSAVSCAACFALTIGLALVMSRLHTETPGGVPGSAAASIFTGREALGYVVIAILAFCLGALVTILCFRVRKHTEENRNDDRAD